jgi:hypothetical protein
MNNTANYPLIELLLALAAAADSIPQGRCDCATCWSVELKQDGLWYCRSCGRYVATDLL